jgi:hypothetical protein
MSDKSAAMYDKKAKKSDKSQPMSDKSVEMSDKVLAKIGNQSRVNPSNVTDELTPFFIYSTFFIPRNEISPFSSRLNSHSQSYHVW